MNTITFKGQHKVPFWPAEQLVKYGLTIVVRYGKGKSVLNPDWPYNGPTEVDVIRELNLCSRAYISYSPGKGSGRGFVTMLCGPYAINTSISDDGALVLTRLGIAISSNEQRAKVVAQSKSKPIEINGVSLVDGTDFNNQWESQDQRYSNHLNTRAYVEQLLKSIAQCTLEPISASHEPITSDMSPTITETLQELEYLVKAEYEAESLEAANRLPYRFNKLRPRSKSIVYRQAFELELDELSYEALTKDAPSLLKLSNHDGADDVLFEIDELEPQEGKRVIYVSTERQTDTRRLPAEGELKVAALPTQLNVRTAVIEKLKTQETQNSWLAALIANEYQPPNYKPTHVELPPSEHPPTPSQHKAILAGAGSPDYTLVLGPPGTGKTTVILSWVRHFASQGKRILITSKNNKAVDNVLERLIEDELCECIRVGNEAKVSSSLHHILIDAKATELQLKLFGNINGGLKRFERALQYVNYLATHTSALVSASQIRSAEAKTIGQTECRLTEIAYLKPSLSAKVARLTAIQSRLQQHIVKQSRSGFAAIIDWFSPQLNAKKRASKRLKSKLKNAEKELCRLNEEKDQKVGILKSAKAKLSSAQEVLQPLEDLAPEGNLDDFSLPDSSELQDKQYTEAANRLNLAYERAKKCVNELRESRQQSLYELLLSQVNVVGATCIGINTKEIFRNINFDVVIVDESGQIQLHDIMVPLSRAERAILVGDHKQLPPIVNDDLLKELVDEREIDTVALGYQQSWFETLWNRAPVDKKFILDTQFRCPAVISDYVSEAFYEGKYYAGKPMFEKTPLFDIFRTCMLFIDTKNERPNFERRKDKDLVGNPTETALVVDILAYAISQHPYLIEKREIGIIVPYKKHIEEIRNAIKKAQRQGTLPSLTMPLHELVASVDSFQGQERDLIIFPFTRANPFGNIGFLQDWRRLNVAQTRAKRQLLMVGHSITLTSKPTENNKDFKMAMRLLIKKLRENKGYWHAATLRKHMQGVTET